MTMRTREEILKMLKAQKNELEKIFSVQKLALFGSYARNEQTENSDIDILVEVPPSIGLEFVTLAERLENILDHTVDLVSRRAIKPNRWNLIEPDLIYV
jgi:uncharacterized protein